MTIEDKIMRYFIAGISYIIGITLGASGILCIANTIKMESGLFENIIGIFAGISFVAMSFYIFYPKE